MIESDSLAYVQARRVPGLCSVSAVVPRLFEQNLKAL